MTSLPAVIDAYRTCELATLTKDGSPVAWPTSGLRLDDGTFLLTTSLGYPQKAYNIRRDSRVALLFSEPAASGLAAPEQILVRGVATCPEEVHTEPSGDLGRLWALLMERQPSSQKYLNWPTNTMTDFYYMRLKITVQPTKVVTRPLPTVSNAVTATGLLGAEVLAQYPTVVLIAIDEAGAPTLVRTTVAAEADGYRVEVPEGTGIAEGPAGLLVHRHDEKLAGLHNANIRGILTADEKGWLLLPSKLVEPGQRSRASVLDPIRIGRECQATTRRYLDRRNLARPSIPWDAYRAIRASLPKSNS
ncbi:pyridoxamine 5'-phosphate oxidase family protein [Actinoplanes sp. L3-i22]|uniref:pyridoxamine 5'-phosphate oxidase family protein n=1 Tax=Actinoplanes sp. L3-i22 TaxID=2836373 RepID=UPI001C845EA0|nr:pyridoxamine 5'-phosphate oxidase family protein [Actinoplanes sp. L3-i22]